MSAPTCISVIGTGEADAEEYERAREVGRLAAERGGVVVCGGRGGVMQVFARGASKCGGVFIGILPDESREQVKLYLSYSLVSGIGQARNLAVACSGEAVITLGGWELPGHVTVAGSPEEAVDAALRLSGE